jgi:hypothetical protein
MERYNGYICFRVLTPPPVRASVTVSTQSVYKFDDKQNVQTGSALHKLILMVV